TPRGEALYMDLPGGTEDPGEGAAWFRSNPHKVSLLHFYLVDPSTGQAPRAEEITGARQQLDLWTGTISSSFRFRGRECRVVTTAGPEQAVLASSSRPRDWISGWHSSTAHGPGTEQPTGPARMPIRPGSKADGSGVGWMICPMT